MREMHEVAERILKGGAITFEEAGRFIELDAWPDVLELASEATRIRERFTGKEVDLCALVNAKAVLLVNNYQGEFFEFYGFLQKRVGANK